MKKIILLLSFALIFITAHAMQPDVQIDDNVFVRYEENSDQKICLGLYTTNLMNIGLAVMIRKNKSEFDAALIRISEDWQKKGYGSIFAALTLKECLKKIT